MTSNSESRGQAARAGLSARRVLVCAAQGGACAPLAARLAAAGYEVQSVGAGSAAREIENFSPQVVFVEAPTGPGGELPDFVRRPRAADEGARLPLVVVFGEARGARDDGAGGRARSLARAVGADDCFAISTPAPEVLARLDALFWRVETGRSLAAARAAQERRTEIEGFMQLLEDARSVVAAGATGALALVAPVITDADAAADGAQASDESQPPRAADGAGERIGARSLRAAHEFLGRNLRRADSVAFYGPGLLVACLPRHASDAARADLARLHAEFSALHPDARIAIGVARFPEDGAEIEQLIERAEDALEDAREATREAARREAARRDVVRETTTSEMSSLTRETPSLTRVIPRRGGDVHEGVRGEVAGALEIGRTLIVGEGAAESSGDGSDAGDDADAPGEVTLKSGGGAAGRFAAESGEEPSKVEDDAAELGEATAGDGEAGAAERARDDDGEGTRGVAASLKAGGARGAWATGRVSPGASAREASLSKRGQRALRESQRGESFETSILPAQGAAEAGGVLARAAAEAAARERERRARGTRMPRRLLLVVSDPARMAQVNLLLRSASYEVRAAFDGSQALDLLRIERADLLMLDLDLKHFDAVEVLRRLNERHRGRLPLPVLLLHPRTEEGARACAAARTLGARAFVALPYDPAELLEAVRAAGASD